VTPITKTRFAPTPSGFLHLGNICNLLLIHCYSKLENLHLSLRIDDIDRSRFRLNYLEDIFRVVDFLGVPFDSGPTGIQDFEINFSQHKKIDKYQTFLDEIIKDTFLCECTRKTLRAVGEIYPGYCHSKNIISGTNLKRRISCPNGNVGYFSKKKKETMALREVIGDFILWNYFENRPSYQLVSIVEDLGENVDFIVRGADLLISTYSQELLKRMLMSEASTKEIAYIHHSLLTLDGQKISKSVQRSSGRSVIDIYSLKEVLSYFWNWFTGEVRQVNDMKQLQVLFFEKVKTPSYESVFINFN